MGQHHALQRRERHDRRHEHNTVSLDQHDFIEKAWLRWRERVAPSRPGGGRGDTAPRVPARDDLDMLTSPQALAANNVTTLSSSLLNDIDHQEQFLQQIE